MPPPRHLTRSASSGHINQSASRDQGPLDPPSVNTCDTQQQQRYNHFNQWQFYNNQQFYNTEAPASMYNQQHMYYSESNSVCDQLVVVK